MRKWTCSAALTLLAVLVAAGCGTEQTAGVAGVETVDRGECIVMPGHMAKTEFSVEHEGETFYFCCNWCVGEFQSDPDKYLSGAAAEAEEHDHH